MMPQAKAFLDESTALAELIAQLTDDDFAKATAFKGWTINDVIGHLHTWNRAAHMSLTDEAAFQEFYAAVAETLGAGGTLNTFERQWLDGLQGRALADTWIAFAREAAARFGDADPSARVKWAGPDMSVRSSITARLMETWAHGQEVYDELGVVRQNEDRIQNIVILGVNTFGWTYACRGETPPGPMPHLRLTAPSGAMWSYGDESLTDLIEGAAEEFCQVVTQVRNIADTSLAVTGLVATDWMSKAQCFAGAPETPPAPGTRVTSSA